MGQNIIVDTILIVLIVGSYIIGKYVMPGATPETKDLIRNAATELEFMATFATKFVIWAKEFMKDKPGAEKMNEVVKQLEDIANKYNINLTTDQLKAIAQTAYENLMGEDFKTKKKTKHKTPTLEILNEDKNK